jgi:hypothetical protein
MSLENFRRTQSQLDILRTAWEETPQSRGGIVALRGFHYQLITVLVQLIRNWSEKAEDERSRPLSGLLLEALSDLTTEDDTGVVACQVKLTQSSGAVRSALEEFWLIDQIALRTVPQLHNRLKFRIISRQTTLRDVTGTIEKWSPAGETDAMLLESFLKKVSATVEPDPEAEFLAILANRFHATDPLEKLTTWLGRLLRGSTSDRGFEEALLNIWSDLQTLHAQDWLRRPPGYLWTDNDLPPKAVTNGPVLVGQRPTIGHLRNGYFANRDEIYDGLGIQIERWLASPTERSIPKVQIFWIGGRSGSGKTVALLHVLARLHERGDGIVIWLEDKLRLLPESVRWCRPLLREGRTVIIGIDDPYNPLNQGDTDSALTDLDAELMVLRQQVGQASMPYIVCCGPSEQRIRLKKDYSSVVDISFTDLPNETPQELQSIWTWFCNRTGINEPLPYHSNSDVLLVQLFFEWRTGQPIADFAARFRKRIRGMEQGAGGVLEDFISRMLALNRLYTGYPAGVLNDLRQQPEFDAAFRRLQAEEHHLVIEEFGVLSGLRLTHPHLANALYDAWYDPIEDEPYRIAHLRAGITDAIEYNTEPRDRVAPLWAIARSSTRARGDLAERLSPELLRLLLPEVYVELQKQFDNNLPSWLIPVWVEFQSQFQDLQLEPSPLDLALLIVDEKRIHETGLRLTCHKLLQHLHELTPEYQARITDAVYSLLLQCPSWREWAAVAIHYLVKTRRRDLGSVISSWVSSHRLHSDAPNLLEVALDISADQEIFWAACLWLDSSAPEHPSWSFVWQHLFQIFPRHNSVLKRGRSWLDRVDPGNPSWGHVWQDLNRAQPQDEELIQMGQQWLEKTDPEEGAWAFVWQDLRRALPHSQELIDSALNWLDSVDVNNRSWTFVWEDLWNAMPSDVRIIERGRQWLEQSDKQQRSWTFMWQDLWSVQPAAGYLIDLGIQWLDQAEPEDAVWYFVWNDLSGYLPEGLIDRACVRLNQTDPKSSDWPRLWLNSYRLKLPSKQLNELGKNWLMHEAPERPEWVKIWDAMRRLEPDDYELLKLGRNWIDSGESLTPGWVAIWIALWQKSFERDDLIKLAVQWLDEAFTSGEAWGLIWDAVYSVCPERENLLTLGRRWLKETDQNNKYWGLVWARLYRAGINDEELTGQGLNWLDEAALWNQYWGLVWMMLIRVRSDNPELLDLGRSWLQAANPRGVWFGFIWGAISASGAEDLHLDIIGQQWLDNADPKKGYWGTNWDAFRRDFEDDDNLRRHGLRWIQQAEPSARFWGYAWNVLRKTWCHYSEFLEVGFDWLLRAPIDNPSWSYVWLILQSLNHNEPRLRETARRFLLEATPENTNWQFLFAHIWRILPKEETSKRAENLLQGKISNQVWPIIWLAMYESGFITKDLLQSAHTWITQTPFNGSQWRYVWEIVNRTYVNDEKVFEIGKGYLTAPYIKKNETWRKLWGTLFKVKPKDEDLFRIGVEWLEETDSTLEKWRETLQILIRKRPGDEKLFAVGLSCLSSPNLNLDGWNQLWQAMLKARPFDSELSELGQKRLEEADCSKKGWDQIWNSAFKADPSNKDLFRMGEAFVREQTKHFNKVTLILGALCKSDPQHENLRNLALNLLRENEHGDNWYQLWLVLFEICPSDSNVLDLGLRNLHATPRSSYWHALWGRLYQQYPDLEVLWSVAQWWLKERFVIETWAIVWQNLFTSTKYRELSDLGRQWLRVSPVGINGWHTVWEALYRQLSTDNELRHIGETWIDKATLSSQGWATVWLALFEVEPCEALLQAGLNWLNVISKHKQWANVWKACWEARSGNEHLYNLGVKFLDHASAEDWVNVWLTLISAAGKQEDLIEKALQWLDQNLAASNTLWLQAWLKLQRLRPDDDSLLSSAQRKLDLIGETDDDLLPVREALVDALSKLSDGRGDT